MGDDTKDLEEAIPMTEPNTELLPCPFCGGEAQYTTDQDAYSYTTYGRPWFSVGCEICGITFNDKLEWDENSRITKECHPKDSFEAWNTRPNQSPWRPIEEAPRDGRELRLLHKNHGECRAKWGAKAIWGQDVKRDGITMGKKLGEKEGWLIFNGMGGWIMVGNAYTHFMEPLPLPKGPNQ